MILAMLTKNYISLQNSTGSFTLHNQYTSPSGTLSLHKHFAQFVTDIKSKECFLFTSITIANFDTFIYFQVIKSMLS